jgi:hypothetical protein
MSRKQPKRKQRSGVDTPLHYAAADDQEEQVIQLLAAGAIPNA